MTQDSYWQDRTKPPFLLEMWRTDQQQWDLIGSVNSFEEANNIIERMCQSRTKFRLYIGLDHGYRYLE